MPRVAGVVVAEAAKATKFHCGFAVVDDDDVSADDAVVVIVEAFLARSKVVEGVVEWRNFVVVERMRRPQSSFHSCPSRVAPLLPLPLTTSLSLPTLLLLLLLRCSNSEEKEAEVIVAIVFRKKRKSEDAVVVVEEIKENLSRILWFPLRDYHQSTPPRYT